MPRSLYLYLPLLEGQKELSLQTDQHYHKLATHHRRHTGRGRGLRVSQFADEVVDVDHAVGQSVSIDHEGELGELCEV